MCGSDLLYPSISQRQISIRGNVRLIKMNVRWSKRRVKTSKGSAGTWINLGLNSPQTHWRQEFYYTPYQESKSYFPSVVMILISMLIWDPFHLFHNFFNCKLLKANDKVIFWTKGWFSNEISFKDAMKYIQTYQRLRTRMSTRTPMAHCWPTSPIVIPRISLFCTTTSC